MPRIEGIDRLRALAAIWVVFAHTLTQALPDQFMYVFAATPAVSLFFVISGFCIHHPYIHRPLSIKAFLAARLIRILPTAMIAAYFAKLVQLDSYNFVDGFILWSIVCELWYYLLYPVFLLLSRRLTWPGLFVISFVAAVTLTLLEPRGLTSYGPWLTWIIGLPAWLTGCFLADRYDRLTAPTWAMRVFAPLGGSLTQWLSFKFAMSIGAVFNGFAILGALWLSAEIKRGGRNLLDWIGTWSFSLYLYHIIAHKAVVIWLFPLGWRSPEIWLISIPAVFLVSFVAYLAVERPFHLIAKSVFRWLDTPRQVLSINTL